MKIFHAFVAALLCVLLVACTAWLVWSARSVDGWRAFSEWVAGGRLVLVCGALGLVCLIAVYGLSAIPRGKRERYLSFDSEGGTVSISSAAICDYVAKLSQEFPSVMKLSPSVVPRKNMIDITVDLRVKAGPSIHEVCELMQQRVRECLTNGLGISQIGQVVVSVKDIVSEHKPG
jgi:uncharacterized alkaline shock family protein YloU